MTFNDCCTLNFSLPESQYVSTHWTVFMTMTNNNKVIFSPFVNIFFAKTCFFIHITLSSNFTWPGLVSQQKFDDGPLSGVATILKKKYFCKIKIIFAINQFQTLEFTFMEKIFFLFFFIECPSYLINKNWLSVCFFYPTLLIWSGCDIVYF